ncbi:MAG: fibronectin type III domain-containing protein [Terriglobales bacterium]
MLRPLQRRVRLAAGSGGRRNAFLMIVCGWAVLGLGCGQVGPPLPPSPNLLAAVTDLSAERRGETLHLAWTAPLHNSDGTAPRGAAALEVCAWPTGVAFTPDGACSQPLLQKKGATWAALPATLELPISTLRQRVPGTEAALAVRYVNERGRSLGWSRAVTAPLAPAAPVPTDVTAALSPVGIRLAWQEASTDPGVTVRVYRRTVASDMKSRPSADPVMLAELPAVQTNFLDGSVERKQAYTYTLRSYRDLGSASPEGVESEATPPLQIVYRDIFPPNVPSGLQALRLPGGSSGVDLTWDAVPAPDLAGYNVYRRVGAEWEKRNTTLLLTPVFHDPDMPTQSVAYSVTAVDESGNESSRSVTTIISP